MLRFSALICLALLLASCGSEAPRTAPPAAIIDTASFPDVPLPPGFAMVPGEDQLAISIAEGGIRRLKLALRQVRDDERISRDSTMQWFRDKLPYVGWKLHHDGGSEQIWHPLSGTKDEELLVETGRSSNRTIIRLTLAPPVSER